MKTRNTRRLVVAMLVVVALVSVARDVAQVSTASVTGTVEDAGGARMPNATVKLINTETGTENVSNSGHSGTFVLTGVLPGVYLLEIERSGFATVEITGLTLSIGETRDFLVRMGIGPVTQTIEVDAAGLAPDSSGALSTVVDRNFVSNIPMNGRSFQDLISMTPGISNQTPQAFGGNSVQGDFSVNGQQPDTNSYTIDGVSADIGVGLLESHTKFASSGNAAGTTALGTTQSLVSVDDLQEFRALTSNYSAEYGRTFGGQFTLLTRSGTNAIHGSIYDYVRNNAADSADWFAGFNSYDVIVPYHQNDFGAAIGGPLRLPGVHDRGETFYFGSYEGLRVTEPTAPLIQYVPSAQTTAAAPAPLQKVLELFPGQEEYPYPTNNPPASTGLNVFVPGELPEPGSINSTSIRVDHSFSSRISGFFRSSLTPSNSESILLNSLTANYLDTQADTLGATFQLSAGSTNEFRLGYGASTSLLNTSQNGLFSPVTQGSVMLNAELGIPAGTFPSAAADVFFHSAGAGDSEINTDEAFGSVHQWNLRDTFTVQAAHHLLQFGIDQRHLVSTIHPPALSVEADFFNVQSLLANSASDISITKNLAATPVFNQFAAFVQDDWQASKALTISGGLRWDIDPAPHGRGGADAFTAVGNPASPASLSLAPRGTSLWNTSWLNVAPRLGAAWTFDGHTGRELVVRAGGGVFFDTYDRAAAHAFSALGFSETMHPTHVPVPVTPTQLDFSITPSPPCTQSLVFAFPHSLQLPYSAQWNVTIEKALGTDQILSASYVGAAGRRLLREQRTNINEQNPEFGEIETFPAGITSNYQALQLKFQRSMAHGLQGLASYTWSHAIDYGSIDEAWPLTRADSNLDLRHNFQAALSWDQHELSRKGFRGYAFDGWGADLRIAARSAFPVTPLGNIFSDPATGERYFSGVDLIPNRPLYLYGSQFPGGRMFNGGPYVSSPAFALPSDEAPGNAPRNMVRGFGDNQVNIAIRREIPLHDHFNLQLRGEAYNLFNHPDLGYVDPSLTDALFGQATLMLNQSFGPTGSLYEPGGPRSLQISARLHF